MYPSGYLSDQRIHELLQARSKVLNVGRVFHRLIEDGLLGFGLCRCVCASPRVDVCRVVAAIPMGRLSYDVVVRSYLVGLIYHRLCPFGRGKDKAVEARLSCSHRCVFPCFSYRGGLEPIQHLGPIGTPIPWFYSPPRLVTALRGVLLCSGCFGCLTLLFLSVTTHRLITMPRFRRGGRFSRCASSSLTIVWTVDEYPTTLQSMDDLTMSYR